MKLRTSNPTFDANAFQTQAEAAAANTAEGLTAAAPSEVMTLEGTAENPLSRARFSVASSKNTYGTSPGVSV